MANEKPVITTQSPTTPIDQRASEHLKKLLVNLEAFAGKAGMNPFLFKAERIDPLVVAKNYDGILAIPLDVQPLVSDLNAVKDFQLSTAQIAKSASTTKLQ